MTKLPVVSGRDLVNALAEIGYLSGHQTASHIILRHHAPPHCRHKEIAKGTLKNIIREAG